MRILLLGATGYVGSRLVPGLLDDGHTVVAASSSPPAPERFSWGTEVEWQQCDIADRHSVDRAVEGADAICYLVHSLDSPHFADLDRLGAQHVRRAADAHGVRRIVYLSGLVPDVPEEELSRHLASRLEVEQILTEARCSTLALRAGVVVGAGSTSFEVIHQIAALLVVQPVPSWLNSWVQPVAVTDVVHALRETLEHDEHTGSLDVGGPDVLPYADMLACWSRATHTRRLRVPVPGVPVSVTALGSALICAAPFWTVTALIESLRHDMVCRPDQTWTPRDGTGLMPFVEAMTRAVGTGAGPALERPLPSDPDWTRMRVPVLDALPAPATVRAGAHLLLHRGRTLWRAWDGR